MANRNTIPTKDSMKALALTLMLLAACLAIPTSLRVFRDGDLFMLPFLGLQIASFGVNAFLFFRKQS